VTGFTSRIPMTLQSLSSLRFTALGRIQTVSSGSTRAGIIGLSRRCIDLNDTSTRTKSLRQVNIAITISTK
ncbi:hypothetical protein GP486_008720, partial [Trichoglossum hirsutum]